MREGFAFVAFTRKGALLAEKLRKELGGTVNAPDAGSGTGAEKERTPLAEWTAENFSRREALIFVGAAGIAVRAVAPHLRSKTEDPAVLCIDECGNHVIPLLSGHLGGANRLARRVAALLGAEAVLTTATDLEGLFAVDLWADRQGMAVLQPERIRQVSAKILRGETIRICCPYPVSGELPERVETVQDCRGGEPDVVVSYRARDGEALQLIPRCLILGVGCRRGTDRETLDAVFSAFCRERKILPQAVAAAASIDLKRDEDGLNAFCRSRDWPVRYYSAPELRVLEGPFSHSDFVESQVGVDNVCERAACFAGGKLVERKYAASGVTFALAECPRDYDWSW